MEVISRCHTISINNILVFFTLNTMFVYVLWNLLLNLVFWNVVLHPNISQLFVKSLSFMLYAFCTLCTLRESSFCKTTLIQWRLKESNWAPQEIVKNIQISQKRLTLINQAWTNSKPCKNKCYRKPKLSPWVPIKLV